MNVVLLVIGKYKCLLSVVRELADAVARSDADFDCANLAWMSWMLHWRLSVLRLLAHHNHRLTVLLLWNGVQELFRNHWNSATC